MSGTWLTGHSLGLYLAPQTGTLASFLPYERGSYSLRRVLGPPEHEPTAQNSIGPSAT
jgi:hypothetical protein